MKTTFSSFHEALYVCLKAFPPTRILAVFTPKTLLLTLKS